jgi:FlaA1/EpsC-like NDP-sugar epimerase
MEGVSPEIKVIGTRHGENFFEALLSRKERVKATDEGPFFRVRLDARSLNCGFFFDQSSEKIWNDDVFTSHYATRIDQTSISELLMELPECAGNQKMSTPLNQLSCQEPKEIDCFRIVFENFLLSKAEKMVNE